MTVNRISQFKSALKNDERLKRLKKMRESGIFAVDTERLITELETIHGTRKIRTLNSSDFLAKAQKKLIDMSLENVAKRSRCVEIRMKVFKLSALLEHQLVATKIYLGAKYSAILASEYKLVTDRKMAIGRVLEDYEVLLSKFKTVEKLADMVIEDCDQTGYGISNISRAIEISFAKERNI